MSLSPEPQLLILIWGFPKNRGAILGVPIIRRTIIFWGLYWGFIICGNCHIALLTYLYLIYS